MGIVGGGPAGLLLAHLLHRQGIESIVLEARSREHVEQRARAGVLEQPTVDLLTEAGLGERMQQRKRVCEGIEIRFDGGRHLISTRELAGGRTITIYGQAEIQRDLVAARRASGQPLLFEAEVVGFRDLDSERPLIRYRHGGAEHEIECDVIAGCDGANGPSRHAAPAGAFTVHARDYPVGWLAILAQAAPSVSDPVWAYHEQGFALNSMRSPEQTRLYLQCDPHDTPAEWSADRIWEELQLRLATDDDWTLQEGPILDTSVVRLRSLVIEPLRYGRLFLAGDAAHVVSPIGAKGLNLAVADVRLLAEALTAWYASGDPEPLASYSARSLQRVWKIQQFTSWLTCLFHRFPEHDEYDARLQRAQLASLCASHAARTSLAESFVGLEHVPEQQRPSTLPLWTRRTPASA